MKSVRVAVFPSSAAADRGSQLHRSKVSLKNGPTVVSRRAPPPAHSDMFSILDVSPPDGDLVTQPLSSLNPRLMVNNADCVADPASEASERRVGASLDWDQSRTRSACPISSRKEAVRNRGSRSSHLCPRSPKREELPFPKANTLAPFTGSGLEHRSPPPSPRPD